MLPLTTVYQNPKPYKAVITSALYVLQDNSTAWQAPHYLVTIPQGFSNAQRIGRQVRVFYIDFVYNFECQGTFAKGGSGRIVIVYDKQNNSSSISAVNVFNQNSFFSNQRTDTADRFIILYDQIISPISVTGDFNSAGQFRLPLDHDIFYSGPNGLDTISGAFFLLFSQTGSVSGNPRLNYSAQTLFYDK